MKKIRLTALFMALLLCGTNAAACGSAEAGTTDTTAADVQTTAGQTETTALTADIPIRITADMSSGFLVRKPTRLPPSATRSGARRKTATS